jgi:hypothetical protein
MNLDQHEGLTAMRVWNKGRRTTTTDTRSKHMTLTPREGAELGLDALSLATLEAMKLDLLSVIGNPIATSARRNDASALFRAIDRSIDRTLGWVEAVREALDAPTPPLCDIGAYYSMEQDDDPYRDLGGES